MTSQHLETSPRPKHTNGCPFVLLWQLDKQRWHLAGKQLASVQNIYESLGTYSHLCGDIPIKDDVLLSVDGRYKHALCCSCRVLMHLLTP